MQNACISKSTPLKKRHIFSVEKNVSFFGRKNILAHISFSLCTIANNKFDYSRFLLSTNIYWIWNQRLLAQIRENFQKKIQQDLELKTFNAFQLL